MSAAALSSTDLAQVKAGMRTMWMAGDFGVIARNLDKDAVDFARRLSLSPGQRVLDIATGTGNLALPIARAGAVVTGVDIAPNLLQQARSRAAAEGLSIQFDEGDAEALSYADASFDMVVSMFGAMFAPRPERVAAEMARLLRPGGTLAMANWTPGGFSGQMFAVGARHAAPPPGIAPPVRWGDPSVVRERLASDFHNIRTQVVPLIFDHPADAAGTVAHFRRYFGPTQAAFLRLNAAGQHALAADLTELWANANTAANPDRQTLVQNEYLQVTATRNEPA